MTVYEFRREIQHVGGTGWEPSGIETLTVRADAADIAVIMTIVRDRLIADMPQAPARESALARYCTACGASNADTPVRFDTGRCLACEREGFKPVDKPS